MKQQAKKVSAPSKAPVKKPTTPVPPVKKPVAVKATKSVTAKRAR